MSEERKQILKMLSEGKIDISEAERLLDAIGESTEIESPIKSIEKGKPKYLRVQVEPKTRDGERVNIRIPVQLIKAGAKMASFMPRTAKEKVDENLKSKGIDLNLSQMNRDNIDGFIEALRETSIDVDSEDEIVKIFCE